MSDYDGVQVSGQRDAGKCSAVQLVTVTQSLFHRHRNVLFAHLFKPLGTRALQRHLSCALQSHPKCALQVPN